MRFDLIINKMCFCWIVCRLYAYDSEIVQY